MINKLSLCALSVLAALPVGTVALAADSDMQLQQVLMLSRHNLRAPLADNGSVLEQSTKKSWPQWDVPGGQLFLVDCSSTLPLSASGARRL